jgi:prevent-host-death family protein
MEISTKELRIQPGKILDQVAHGEEITVTYRGKALARIVPIASAQPNQNSSEVGIFGMWKDEPRQLTVDETVRAMRRGRQF